MGADGHVVIYDFDKAIKLGIIKDPENEKSSGIPSSDLCKVLRSYFVYIQTIFGHKIITVYWDTERIDRIDSSIKSTKQQEEIAKKLEECYIDTWEVWT